MARLLPLPVAIRRLAALVVAAAAGGCAASPARPAERALPDVAADARAGGGEPLEPARAIEVPAGEQALALYMQARIAFSRRDAAQALALLMRAAMLAPASAPIELALAQAQLANGDEPGARTTLRLAVAHAPDDAHATLLLARLELRSHDLASALLLLLALAERGAADREALEMLHPLLLAAGETQRGLDLFSRESERAPEVAAFQEARADFLAVSGREAEAIDGYRRALALEPARRSAELKLVRLMGKQVDRNLQRLDASAGAGVGISAAADAAGGAR